MKASYVASGDRYAAENKPAEAKLEYLNALRADPRDGEVRLKLAEAYVKAGQGYHAALEYIRAADVLESRTDVQIRAGSLLLLGGRFDDAKVRAEKALALEPKNVEAQILFANALAGLKDLNAAVEEIEEAIKLDPDRSDSYTNLGVIEVTRGKREAAEQAFRKAIELDPRSTTALLALANFHWVGGRLDAAGVELAKALEIDPTNTLALRVAANFALTQNRLDDAEKYLRRIVEITKSPEATVALADFYIARSDEGAARGLLQPLSSARDGGTAATLRLAALDHAAGRKDQAYEQIDKVLTSGPVNLQALLVKSKMLLADGRRDDALLPAELAVKSHPESTSAFYALGRVQAVRNQTDAAIAAFKEALRLNPRAAGVQVALAQMQLTKGNAAESIGLAQEAVRADPRNPDARLALVRGLLVQGEIERAKPEVARLVAEYPNVPAAHVQKGILHVRTRDTAGARAEFETALRLDPGSIEALGGLVALELTARQPGAAQARLMERAAAADASTSLLMLAARTSAATGDLPGAEGFLRRLLSRDASYLPAYSALGQIYLRQRRLDEALKEFEAMAAKDPRPVAPLTLVGMIQQAQGKQTDAEATFGRVLGIDSSAPVASNNLAWLLAQSGRNLDLALQYAQTAQRGLPESPEVSDTLGVVYYRKGLFSLAIPALKASTDKDPSSATYHLHLGLAYAKNGNTAQARQTLQRAISLKLNPTDEQEARAMLAMLPGL